MIPFKDTHKGMVMFVYDECPICEGWEHRADFAREYGCNPQFEHCGCDKTEFKFYMGGYCSDALVMTPKARKNGARRTGRAYRRQQTKRKNAMAIELASTYGYAASGWVVGENGREHLILKRKCEKQKFFKKHANRVNRRRKTLPTGQRGAYKREFDYRWMVY